MTNIKKLTSRRVGKRIENKRVRTAARMILSGGKSRVIQPEKWGRRPDQPPVAAEFTGTCPVRQHTGDGHYVGWCWHSTYDGLCPLHGDVSQWLPEGSDRTGADDRLIPRG